MPVAEPNLDRAREKGREVAAELLSALIRERGLCDVTAAPAGALPQAVGRWEAAKARFVSAVEELFAEDAINSF